ncbi:DHHC zinc finger domain-containing protein [Polychaeton citri CBS 116435]|uniref:Palmitoyltransferase PFA4 n=1 Tax=Polychaeton citri CBS 116435 TaxID=1314669 RepID=A0A9P4QEC5_9PEZI|nr:DHHC zinc finger domain-containing protein [Polychaeton citri CBS 116435]
MLQRLAFPSVASLIAFLAFTSQYLFHYIEPGPLQTGNAFTFNVLIALLYICYTRTCFTDPGRIPSDWATTSPDTWDGPTNDPSFLRTQRWCRRCESPKPPRAHHCKTCKRCISKMDHHCVWTANCVSHVTLPHFVRFLFYAVVSMIYLECFLYQRVMVIWYNRRLPSYLGPSVGQFIHLFTLVVTNSFVLFMLILLLGRTLWSLSLNMTTIEGWEVERHETVLRRQRILGGYLDAPDGSRIHVERQEYPWDIGIWNNLRQNLGGSNPIAWFWPLAQSPRIDDGLAFEHNEIEDPRKPWPPPDPDRMFRAYAKPVPSDGFIQNISVDGFRQRQAADLRRYRNIDGEYVVRRRPFHERYAESTGNLAHSHDDQGAADPDYDSSGEEYQLHDNSGTAEDGEEAWRNKEGERLADFGVEEDVEFYDEDNVPLAELIKRRKAA